MFTKRYFVFVLFFTLILVIAGCCLLPTPEPNTYIITSSAGEGGTISPLGETTLTEGDSQVFTITADEGYTISDVLVDGVSVGVVSTYTFSSVQQNHTISALFTQETQPPAPAISTTRYTITSSAGTGGSIEPEGSIKVKEGKDKTFTITPLSPCYLISDVLVDGVSVGVVTTYTFNDIQKSHTIQVSFVESGLGIYNVDQDQNYQTIQAAIDDAGDEETIIVCPGTYYENIVFAGKNITVRSVDPSDPDIVDATIIDGGANGSVVKFIDSITPVYAYDTSTLDGFTIQNGDATSGGGIFISNSHPTITRNIIIGNKASSSGGGIWISDFNEPTITDNTITGNKAENDGGGIKISGNSNPIIANNIITFNEATDKGGGIDTTENCPTITGNIITDNKADTGGGINIGITDSFDLTGNTISRNSATNGGGIAVDGSGPTIKKNIIEKNIVIEAGGGIYVSGCNPTITENTIKYNETEAGGGIYILNSSNPTITLNGIESNIADYGGGIYMHNSGATITGNSIKYNNAGIGGGVDLSYSEPVIENNDFIGNTASNKGGGIYLNYFSDLLPDTGRPVGWGTGEEDIPTGTPLVPAEGTEYTIAANKFLGNEHGDPLDYTAGAHVDFE